MENQVIKHYEILSTKEIKNINGGCIGEDIECPELKIILEIFENLKHLTKVF